MNTLRQMVLKNFSSVKLPSTHGTEILRSIISGRFRRRSTSHYIVMIRCVMSSTNTVIRFPFYLFSDARSNFFSPLLPLPPLPICKPFSPSPIDMPLPPHSLQPNGDEITAGRLCAMRSSTNIFFFFTLLLSALRFLKHSAYWTSQTVALLKFFFIASFYKLEYRSVTEMSFVQ